MKNEYYADRSIAVFLVRVNLAMDLLIFGKSGHCVNFKKVMLDTRYLYEKELILQQTIIFSLIYIRETKFYLINIFSN